VHNYWDSVYSSKESTQVSWYQEQPTTSIRLVASVASLLNEIVDVGAGSSNLITSLHDLGYQHLSALDVSKVALSKVAMSNATSGHVIELIVADVTEWNPTKKYDVWHDRAVFHFMTSPKSKSRYLNSLNRALKISGRAVIGTFSEDGPTQCSGLDVCRYSVSELEQFFQENFTMVASEREIHHTPWNTDQSFNWVVLKKHK